MLTTKVEAAPENLPKNQERTEKPSITEKLKAGLFGKPPVQPVPVSVAAEAHLVSEQQEMRVGGKQRVALVFVSKEPLGNAIMRLHFDPKVVAVRSVSPGVWLDGAQTQPSIMQAIDPAGIVAVAISPQAGAPLKTGANVVLFLDIEALAAGESVINFDPTNLNVVTADGRAVKLQMAESRLTVK